MKGVPLMPDYRDNPLDQQVNSEFMRVCKCVIPYLDTNLQKNVAVGLKFLELMNTINAFSETSTFSTNLSLTRQGNWEQDLLRNVRNNLSPEKAYIIDALIKLQEFRSIFNTKEAQQNHSTSTSPPNVPPSPTPTDPTPSFFSPPSSSYDPDQAFEAFEPFNPSESSTYTTNNNTSTNTSHTFMPPPPPPQNNGNNGPSPASMIQMLSPLLDENQRQMLNLFTSFLGNK